MRKQDLQNSELDRIGRDLFKATKPSAEHIEKLVDAPCLFDSVKARIKADAKTRRKPNVFFADRAAWFFRNRQAAAALVLILLALGAALIVFKTPSAPPPQTGQITVPEMNARRAEAEKLFSAPENNKENPPTASPAKFERAALQLRTSKPRSRAQISNRAKTRQAALKSPPEIFYSLASGGTWEANGDDLQIVRAELSRSELFALGVNLPVENEAGKIKTDLLVGPDGTAKAIRFVAKF